MGEGGPEIDYAGPKTAGGKSGLRLRVWTLVLLVFTGLALVTCVRIEILNARVGYYLPRQDMEDVNNPAWRLMSLNEKKWRQIHGRLDPTIETRPLTAAEHAEMTRDVTQSDNRNALQDTVCTLGFLQYPIVVMLLIGLPLTIRAQTKLWRERLIVALVITVVCSFFMFYRGYFTSLGM